jgi:ankyrin repeat protein
VKALVARNVNCAAKDASEGQTPLHIAAGSGACDVLELLLANGADVNLQRASDGYTALHLAVAQVLFLSRLLIVVVVILLCRNKSLLFEYWPKQRLISTSKTTNATHHYILPHRNKYDARTPTRAV